jgi:hypothetical protein
MRYLSPAKDVHYRLDTVQIAVCLAGRETPHPIIDAVKGNYVSGLAVIRRYTSSWRPETRIAMLKSSVAVPTGRF